jgi:fibronectin type 3 domain-containing protein
VPTFLPTTVPPPDPSETSSPGQVTGLAASANGSGSIKLTWNRLQADDILCYKVYRSNSSGGPYFSIAAPAENSFNNTGLDENTTYFYCVSAVNVAQKEGSLSGEVSAKPLPPILAPVALPVLAELFTWDG